MSFPLHRPFSSLQGHNTCELFLHAVVSRDFPFRLHKIRLIAYYDDANENAFDVDPPSVIMQMHRIISTSVTATIDRYSASTTHQIVIC